jgi:hypothetical protein
MAPEGPAHPQSPCGGTPGKGTDRNLLLLGALTMHLVVFLALVGQGCPPREAAAITIGLGIGTAEAIRRLLDSDDGPRSVR